MNPNKALEQAKLPPEISELSARMSVILAESKRRPETYEVHTLMQQLAMSAYLMGMEAGLKEGRAVIKSLVRA